MMDYFLKKVPSILFEPYAIGVLFGMAAALFLFYRNRSYRYWLLTWFIVFITLWRLILFPLMSSSRYASLLIYPTLILTAFLCIRLDVLYQKLFFPRQNTCPRTHILIIKTLSVILVFAFSLAALLKTFHINSYRGYTKSICNTFNSLPKGKRVFLYSGRESMRVKYFTKYPTVRLAKKERNLSENKLLTELVQRTKNIPGEHYFFIFHKAKDPLPTNASLNLSNHDGIFEFIEKVPTSRKKNWEFVLYRFTARCPNIDEWNAPLPPVHKGNLCKNGNFETIRYGNQLKTLENRLKALGLDSYMKQNIFPQSWAIGLIEANKINPPIITLSKAESIKGKISLLTDTRHTKEEACITTNSIRVCDCTYSCFVKAIGSQPSKLNLTVRSYIPELEKSSVQQNLFFELEPRKLYRIHGKILQTDFPLAKDFCISFAFSGYTILDQMEILPVK